MLFKQEDLATDPLMEAANILNESVYLDESEYKLSPKAVPVVENSRLGANIVSFEDIDRLSEENGVDYFDAMEAIAEAIDIDAQSMAVAVPEWKIIADPDIVNEMANVVVKPMPEMDPVNIFVESCVNCWIDSGDESYLDLITEGMNSSLSNMSDEQQRLADAIGNELDKALNGRSATASVMGAARTTNKNNNGNNGQNNSDNDQQEVSKTKQFLQKVKKYTIDTPREYIAKAINALKNKYQSFKRVADANKTDPSQRSIFQKILAAISSVLDKLYNLLNKQK